MKTTRNQGKLLSAIMALGALGMAPAAVEAQQSEFDEDETLEEVIVIGSRVRSGSVQDSPLPIDSVTGDSVTRAGFPDVGQALQSLLPSFNYSFSTITDGTDSLLPISLRGLHPDHTLVLIDGKRRHASALVNVNGSIGRGSVGVDINAVPAVAFERVDVLRDGASAIYGSDAIAGVMDLRLKRTSPLTLSLHTGEYSAGDGASTRLSASWGGAIGDVGTLFVAVETRDRDNTNRAALMGTVNYPRRTLDEAVAAGDVDADQLTRFQALYNTHQGNLSTQDVVNSRVEQAQTAIMTAEMDLANAADSAAMRAAQAALDTAMMNLETANEQKALIDGVVDESEDALDGSGGAIGCNDEWNLLCDPREFTLNRMNFRIGDPETEQQAFVVNTVWDIGGGELYANTTYSTRDNVSGCFYREADFTNNNQNIYPDGFLPLITTTLEDSSLTAGYRWQQGATQLDFSYNQGENTYDFGLKNSLNASLGDASPTVFYTGGPRYEQTLTNFDGVTELNDQMRVAYGAELRDESYNLAAGELASYQAGVNNDPGPGRMLGEGANPGSSNGSQCFPGFRPETSGAKSRDSFSAYAEFGYEAANVTASAALRYEDYSDFGDDLTWRFAGLLKLSDNIRLRGSIGTSLRAPSLPQLFYNTISTINTTAGLLDTKTLASDDPLLRELGVSQLSQETADNISLGLALQLRDNLSLTLDYYSVDIADRVILSGQVRKSAVEDKIEAGATGNELARLRELEAVFVDNDISQVQFFINATETQTEGTDLVLDWQLSGRAGDLTMRVTTNITDTEIVGGVSRPGFLDLFDEVEIFNRSSRSIIEEYQINSKLIVSANWRINQWSLNASWRTYGEYRVTTNAGDSQDYDPSSVLDLSGSWSWQDRLLVTVGGTNILDAEPEPSTLPSPSRRGTILDIVDSPRGPFTYTNSTAPFGINGAYFYGEVSYRF